MKKEEEIVSELEKIEWLTLKQAAARAGVHHRNRRWQKAIRNGDIKRYRLFGRHRYLPDDIDEWRLKATAEEAARKRGARNENA